jgi:4-amino-4-deoxy-L-arabinose transferase-like glycosyltransferase
MIFEICRTIFNEPEYALFGTLACISCSSYVFWTNFCKDHLLVAFLVTAILFLLVKLWNTEQPVYLAASFFIVGLLAWARPELALAIVVALCVLVVYIWKFMKNNLSGKRDRFIILLSPSFTFIGAIPFFINNYFFTRNIFIPSFILWKNESSSLITGLEESAIIQQNSFETMGSFAQLVKLTIGLNPSTIFTDIYGVFFNPQSRSMGLFPLAPLFLITLLLSPFIIISKKIHFEKKEQQIVGILVLMAFSIFLPYLVERK